MIIIGAIFYFSKVGIVKRSDEVGEDWDFGTIVPGWCWVILRKPHSTIDLRNGIIPYKTRFNTRTPNELFAGR